MDIKTFNKRKEIIYSFICDDIYVPMKIKEIATVLGIAKEDRDELLAVLDALIEEGKIEQNNRGKYVKAITKHYQGIFQSSTRGFGFITVGEDKEDVFVSASNVNNAMHGDEVEFQLSRNSHGKSKEGKITRIIKRNTKEIVGTFDEAKNFGFVIPDNPRFGQDIFVSKERSKGAKDGMKVVVKLTSYGTEKKSPEGIITEILGRIEEPGTDILSIIKGFELPLEFPEKVENQATNVAKDVSEADMAGRMDLRGLRTVTIDGEDARDLDDAITIAKEGDNYILGVHIADVTNYVQENSALDKEALSRGTSVYLVDRVIPMLPRQLSNGICSLNQGQDRLALSCIMTINPDGDIIDHIISESVINVDARMTYTSVKKIIEDKDPEESAKYMEHIDDFMLMAELSTILRNKRHKRGAIDFDIPESKIILDESGKPVLIKPYERNKATKLIEDFMLAANETVAEEYFWRESPFVYRVHEKPDSEKIKKLSTFINNFGYSLKSSKEELHPKEIQKLIEKIEGSPAENLITRLSLRSMKQAKYSPDCDGHFGLAAKYYCHFTSPIRRYPDLQIHRIIKDTLRGRMDDERIAHYNKILSDVAKSSSELERRAEEAERETNKLKKAQYMEAFIGEEFPGVISGMNAYGMYVELENSCEGMVHVTSLRDDFYQYNESSFEMVGERFNKHYKLGESVIIRVKAVDLLRRSVDFEFVNDKREKDKAAYNSNQV